MLRLMNFFLYFNTRKQKTNEYNICKAVLDNLGGIDKQLSSQIAEQSYTSEPTVKRFCQKLGFDSYPSFKREVAAYHSDFIAITSVYKDLVSDNSTDIKSYYYKYATSELKKSKDELDLELVRSLARAISQSARVRLYANLHIPVVNYIHAQLHLMGFDASAPVFVWDQSDDAKTLGAGDIALLIGAPHLMDKAYLANIKKAHGNGAVFAAFFADKQHPLSELVEFDFSQDMFKTCSAMVLNYILLCVSKVLQGVSSTE